ncbi:MAG TPA: hypothetical protein PLU39_09635, partial [Armatimonadota bacterium]|nr:hypothetical protein [Armatimonadota bacterium]
WRTCARGTLAITASQIAAARATDPDFDAAIGLRSEVVALRAGRNLVSLAGGGLDRILTIHPDGAIASPCRICDETG